jgi:hypothetical protein
MGDAAACPARQALPSASNTGQQGHRWSWLWSDGEDILGARDVSDSWGLTDLTFC